jgi:hypothetical protein
VPAESQQTGLIAGDESLEGLVVAAPDERYKPLVGLEAQQRRSPREGDLWLV